MILIFISWVIFEFLLLVLLIWNLYYSFLYKVIKLSKVEKIISNTWVNKLFILSIKVIIIFILLIHMEIFPNLAQYASILTISNYIIESIIIYCRKFIVNKYIFIFIRKILLNYNLYCEKQLQSISYFYLFGTLIWFQDRYFQFDSWKYVFVFVLVFFQ
jgi:hypothetical protein